MWDPAALIATPLGGPKHDVISVFLEPALVFHLIYFYISSFPPWQCQFFLNPATLLHGTFCSYNFTFFQLFFLIHFTDHNLRMIKCIHFKCIVNMFWPMYVHIYHNLRNKSVSITPKLPSCLSAVNFANHCSAFYLC